MKKAITLFLICFSILKCNAQNKVDFGIKGGLNLTFFKIKEAQFGNNIETETGFYGGVFSEFVIDDFTSLQPEILYIALSDFRFINAPIYAKFNITKRLDLLVGPSVNYFFDFFTNKLKIRGDISSTYQITKALEVHVKFVVGFNVIAPNGLFFGLGYKF